MQVLFSFNSILNNSDSNFPKLNINSIYEYDINLPKPDIIFLINGDFIYLRNEIKERYHNDEIKNTLIFNNFILTFNQLNLNYFIINNKYNQLNDTVSKINDIILK